MAQWIEALLDELSSNLRTHGKVKGENRLHKFYPDLHNHMHTCTHTCAHTLTMVVVVVVVVVVVINKTIRIAHIQ